MKTSRQPLEGHAARFVPWVDGLNIQFVYVNYKRFMGRLHAKQHPRSCPFLLRKMVEIIPGSGDRFHPGPVVPTG